MKSVHCKIIPIEFAIICEKNIFISIVSNMFDSYFKFFTYFSVLQTIWIIVMSSGPQLHRGY